MRAELMFRHDAVRRRTLRQLLTCPGDGRKIKLRQARSPNSARILAHLFLLDPPLYLALMQFTEDDLQEFMEIWREEFNEAITAEDARRHATALLDLYAILSSTEPEE